MSPSMNVDRQVNNMISKPTGLVDGPYGAWMVECFKGTGESSETRLGNIRNSLNLVTEAFNAATHFDYSLGYGLTGFLWTIQWLIRYVPEISGIIETDDLKPIIEAECLRMIRERNYDLFDGAHGLMVYLITIDHLTDQVHKGYVDSLESNLRTSSDLIPISTGKDRHSKNLSGINLGIPHGVAGCILMLCKLHQFRPKECCRNLMRKSVRYLLSKSRRSSGVDQWFTFADHPESEYPPLAWCYGDLTAGYTITKAGMTLSHREWIDQGIDILDSTLKRDDFAEEDLSLCHGTPSIAYVYWKAFQLTAKESFRDRSLYWMEHSEQLKERLQNGAQDRSDYQDNASLIYGYPGMELVTATMNEKIPDQWDEWMLI